MEDRGQRLLLRTHVSLRSFPAYFEGQSLFQDLELTNSVRLTGHQAPASYLPWGGIQMLSHVARLASPSLLSHLPSMRPFFRKQKVTGGRTDTAQCDTLLLLLFSNF